MRRAVHIAKVLDSADPDKSGGAKIQVDELVDGAALDDKEFAPGRYPFAGNGEGFFFAPQKGTALEVEVTDDEEEGVESLSPRWVGMLYTNKDKIPTEFQSDHENRGGIKFGDDVFLMDKTKKLLSLISSKVRLGEEEASHPLVRGDTVNQELSTYLSAEDTYEGQVSGFLSALSGALTTWSALPPGTPATTDVLIAFAAAVNPALSTLISGVTTFKSAINAFKSAASSWLSTKCKTE